MSTLDDASIVSLFVQGEKTLAANQHLRSEPAFDSVQLLAKRGGLVATIQYQEAVPRAMVREQSEFFGLVNHVLVEHGFMPMGVESGFYRYEKCTIPAGYQMHMTEARELWREWWRQTRHSSTRGIQMDFLVWDARKTWYPIREITPSHEMLIITTLASEFHLGGNDQIVWLSRLSDDKAPKANSTPTAVQDATATTQPKTLPTGTLSNAQAPAVGPQTATPSRQPQETPAVHPYLKYVLREQDGKLHIKTKIGEIVVEGQDLKYQLIKTSPAETA